jgi:fatty-acyl-CoA synthase
VAAFSVPAEEAGDSDAAGGERLVVIAERAAGTSRADPAAAREAITTAVLDRHGLSVHDVLVLPAGAIPRTTSGKLARRACRARYLEGAWT